MARPLPLEWRQDQQIPPELVELRDHLDRLPRQLRERLVPLCDRIGHFARLQSRLVRIAQDAVDQLQLDIKYLVFDLEATRREREELRQHLRAEEGDSEEDE
jgi:hypothetical protein